MNAVVERKEAQPVAVPEATAILSMIERAARDQSVDIDKFERLMAMRERMEMRAKEEAFNAAMAAVQNELPAIVKDRANDFTKSRYATLDAIVREAGPIYTRHGFSLSFGTEQSSLPGHYRVTCIVSHVGGFSRPYAADLPADLSGSQGKITKTAIQAFGSTLSYGRRYLLCLIFNVAITNEDDDGNGYRQQQAQQQRPASPKGASQGSQEVNEEVEEQDNPTPHQVMVFDECKAYIGAATTPEDYRSRIKNNGLAEGSKTLTVYQRNKLRDYCEEVKQRLTG